MFTLKPEESVQARFDSLNQGLQQLELKPANDAEEKCTLCQSVHHHIYIFPELHTIKEVIHHPEDVVNWVSNSGQFGNNNNNNNINPKW